MKGNRTMASHNKVWADFSDKMREDTLNDDDFTEETKVFLAHLLSGRAAAHRREKFLAAPFEVYQTEAKISVLIHCLDDDYRFDFVLREEKWKLAFVECITLPVADIGVLPYEDFLALPDKEAWIRKEKDISKTVYIYNKFKESLGWEEAIKIFLDGYGECICARSWVPFYSDRLSYIAYAAWVENRINGEKVIVEVFNEEESCIRFCQHIWRRMYTVTGHLQDMIEYSEYMRLFEAIWMDRASASGWALRFEYLQEDTILHFRRIE